MPIFIDEGSIIRMRDLSEAFVWNNLAFSDPLQTIGELVEGFIDIMGYLPDYIGIPHHLRLLLFQNQVLKNKMIMMLCSPVVSEDSIQRVFSMLEIPPAKFLKEDALFGDDFVYLFDPKLIIYQRVAR